MKVRVYYDNESSETYNNVAGFTANTDTSKVLLQFGSAENPTEEIELTDVKNIHAYDED